MPESEKFWNPYRWVTVSDQPSEHAVPGYHHRLSGLSGRLSCELEALTPLLIGDGSGNFVRHARGGPPYVPATSLKGAIRSLAELIGNATVPFANCHVDTQHQLRKARQHTGLDIVARMFGYLHDDSVFAGVVRFRNAELIGAYPPPHPWPGYKVAVGQPKPKHHAFYPQKKNQRKYYHHHPGAKELVRAATGITQTATVSPAPPGTRFRFTVDFENLRDEELDLLLYCLILEKQTTVTLSATAIGDRGRQGGTTLRGPLRHKLGGAKPHGAGSAHIHITKLDIRTDPVVRYRGGDSTDRLEGCHLDKELLRRTESFRKRTDRTMKELRAMLIYDDEDPRKPIQYPTYQWFGTNSNKPLRPTL